ncbi:MAG TPA: hypothetical protein V6C65_15725 [Allocoleopsis sp.]
MALNFDSSADDILWTAEALHQGIVKDGEMMPVDQIIRTANGMGFIITCQANKCTITDYVWGKSKIGVHLNALLENPSEGANTSIQCKAQDKIKNAVLKTVEVNGASWVAMTDEKGRDLVAYVPKKVTPKTSQEVETTSAK